MFGRFSAIAWERDYRRTVADAFSRVPFYRDQWVAAGHELEEPVPTPSEELTGQLHRLCPFAAPYDPAREPSLWIGAADELREALALTGAPRSAPVLEVRQAVLDRRTLGRRGPRYGVLLATGARVVHERRRRELNAPALDVARQAGAAVLVGEQEQITRFLPELDGVDVTPIAHGEAVAFDPHLGYFGARASCGGLHLLWRRFHVKQSGAGPCVTALRRRRPTLAGIVPAGRERDVTGLCREHGTPILGVTP
ncbi:hypothetical protein OIE66_04895 [Nonomuraea sp. NBC_01738]|uniref:hypothetical protein n=1 Tax=Nonomuraea sp. NBC_01738 TaxID=2976003 RepID=UPI002E0D4EFD|nr:hypothetical protein OIE66_04895 [Nonomuraea sp. NBC_01738]